MRLLLDTHILIALTNNQLRGFGRAIQGILTNPDSILHVSVANLWEIAIKTRIGKLEAGIPIVDLPNFLTEMELELLVIDHRHVLTPLEMEPSTRDPFDRLLLTQCQVENLRLITLDRALEGHPLAWRTDDA